MLAQSAKEAKHDVGRLIGLVRAQTVVVAKYERPKVFEGWR